MSALSEESAVEALEVELLLEAIHRHHGFDFRDYTRNSIQRRIRNAVQAEGLACVSELQANVLHVPQAFERLLGHLSVSVTAMFRDPSFFLALRESIVPMLRCHPFVRIWHAGCSTGEEVYSLAVVLHEEGLLERSRIYATDLNDSVLDRARAGIFSLDLMQEYTANYLRAGGKAAFSDYYSAGYGGAILKAHLKRNIVFAQHNLVTDGPFNEFHLVLCRNVLIYFNAHLQARVLRLLDRSLRRFGILGLGRREILAHTVLENEYDEIDSRERLYRKRA